MNRLVALISIAFLALACSKLPKSNPSNIAEVVPGGYAIVHSERLFEKGQVELSSNGGEVLDRFAAKLIANDVRLAIRVQKDERIKIRRDHQPMFSEKGRQPYERALRISAYLQQKGVPGRNIQIIRDPDLPVLDAESRRDPPFELLLLIPDREFM
ncbi:MAG: OmpA family protein [Planctomycetota bacterium]|jgi:hypothetical protein